MTLILWNFELEHKNKITSYRLILRQMYNVIIDSDYEVMCSLGYIDTFSSEGYCIISNLFDASILEQLMKEALSNFNDIMSFIKENNVQFGVGLKKGYDEIVQRHEGRYEVTYKMKSLFQSLVDNQLLMDVVSGILGDDIQIVNESLIISFPGTTVKILCFSIEYKFCNSISLGMQMVHIVPSRSIYVAIA